MKHQLIVLPALTTLLVVAPARASLAQDALGAVKTLYASAAYEDALTTIARVRPAAPSGDSRSLDEYRAFCLLALGREDEATRAIEELVSADPFFQPDQNEVAPRVRTLFSTVRKRLLPGLAQQKYLMAKATFDRKEYLAATDQFARVLKLVDDPEMDANAAGIADIRTLTTGFLELARASAPPAVPVPPTPPEPMPAKPSVPKKAVYDASDKLVTPPVVQRQDLPAYPSTPGLVSLPIRSGVIEVTINESGQVAQVVMRQPVNPVYDPMVLAAAANWRYKPALADGKPVKYRKLIQINVDGKR